MNTQTVKHPFYTLMIALTFIVVAVVSLSRPGAALPLELDIRVMPNPTVVDGNPNDVLCADGTSSKPIRAIVTSLHPDDAIPADTKVTFSTDKGSINSPITLVDGVADTTFRAADIAGTATITASVEDSTGPKTAKTTIYMIGGPITGDTKVNYYCDAASQHGHLSAANGQPPATTYQWTFAGPATLLNPNYPVTTWTGNTATYVGTGASAVPQGDVTATLQYSLHGVSCSSTFTIVVLEPTSLPLHSQTAPFVYYSANDRSPTDPAGIDYSYGFGHQDMTYQILDQFNTFMPSVSWNERWLGIHRPPTANQNTPAPSAVGSGSNADGYITDFHFAFRYNQDPPLNLHSGDDPVEIYSFDKHEFYIGSASDGIGCLVLVHNNVIYTTSGVLNDG